MATVAAPSPSSASRSGTEYPRRMITVSLPPL
jgi:hypothetical protein